MPYYPPIGDIKGAPARSDVATHTAPTDPVAGATDPEFKYVNVRRLSAADDAAAGPGDLAADDGTGTQAAFDKLLEIEGIQGETADTAHASGGGGGAGKVSYSDLSVVMALDDGTVGALEADAPSGTGKTLSASLLGRTAEEDAEAATDGTGLVADVDPAALNHGVSVLAWARVDGVSPLDASMPGTGGGGPHVKVLDGSADSAASDLAVDADSAAGISHATTVLAWARVDGSSPSAGGDDHRGTVEIDSFSWGTATESEATASSANWRDYRISVDTLESRAGDDAPGDVTGGTMLGALGGGSGEDLLVGGTTSHDAADWGGFKGGVYVAAGDVGGGDDVVVDGRIITGQDPAADGHELGHLVGFQHDGDARGEVLTLGFTAMEWGAAATDAGFADVSGRITNVSVDPF